MKTLSSESEAMNGNPLPKGLDVPDQIMYLNLRNLYASLRAGTIDRQTAMNDKRELLHQYEIYQFNFQNCERWTRIWHDTEQARCDYRKHPSIENADKLLELIDGIGR